MGTRSVTIVMHENGEELVRIYRQFDGYPDGHGLELAALCDRMITNGISGDHMGTLKGGELVKPDNDEYTSSNGMGELAAHILFGLKKEHYIGSIYLEAPQGPVNDWAEYVYIVRGKEGEKPTIECTTQPGEYPFNMQIEEGLIFKGTAKEWLEKGKEGFSKDDD
jgi:hypothetical protein